jgi:hypothetical protein
LRSSEHLETVQHEDRVSEIEDQKQGKEKPERTARVILVYSLAATIMGRKFFPFCFSSSKTVARSAINEATWLCSDSSSV